MNHFSGASLERFVAACHCALCPCLFFALISSGGALLFGGLAVALFAASVAAGALATRAERRVAESKGPFAGAPGGVQ